MRRYSTGMMGWGQWVKVQHSRIDWRCYHFAQDLNLVVKIIQWSMCTYENRNMWFCNTLPLKFDKKISYAHKECFYLIKNTLETVILWIILMIKNETKFCLIIFSNVIYSCDDKAEYSTSLLQSSESHDPSEIILIWFAAQNISNYQCWKHFKINFNIINAYMFDEMNASLLNLISFNYDWSRICRVWSYYYNFFLIFIFIKLFYY